MGIEDCFEFGIITKTHGLDGTVIISADVDNTENYKNMESVLLLKNGTLIPFFTVKWQISGNRIFAKFEDINCLEEAENILNEFVYLPLEKLPPLPPSGYYFHDLIGMEVIEDGKTLGHISAVYQPSSQYVAAFLFDNKEVLFPIEEDIIQSVDLPQKKMTVKLPIGLLDLYTNL